MTGQMGMRSPCRMSVWMFHLRLLGRLFLCAGSFSSCRMKGTGRGALGSIPPLIFNDSVKDSKNLRLLFIVIWAPQLSRLNLSHKSRECLLLTVRVPDLKAIKPTLAINSQNQPEMNMEQQLETRGNLGVWDRVLKGPQLLLGLAVSALDSKSWGRTGAGGGAGRGRGGREGGSPAAAEPGEGESRAKVPRTQVSHL